MTAQTKNTKLNNKGLALSKSKGFTLIELLVVIGILAILLAITLIAINPARQFAQARNTQRQSDANAILNAIHAYLADNGTLPTNMPAPGASATIASTGLGGETGDICADLVSLYIAELPVDPSQTPSNDPIAEGDCDVAYDTNYQVAVSSGTNNRVTVTALGTETPPADAQIVVTR